MKLKDYIKYWFFTYRYYKQSASSRAISLNTIQSHIVNSDLGNMEMKDIRTKDLQVFMTQMAISGNKCKIKGINSYGKPLSPWTLRRIRQWLISCFKLSTAENITVKNYAEEIEPISIPYKDGLAFTKEQQELFLNKSKNKRFYLAYLLFFITGCRRAEILGLAWNKINFEENFIYINQTLIMLNEKPTLRQGTKTEKSVRVIPLPEKIMNLLKEHKKEQELEQIEYEQKNHEPYKNVSNLVFCNKDGSMHNPIYFSRNFKNSVKKFGLPKELHLHSTRHTWATNMIQCHIPITDVQALGGWSRPDVLLNIYAHTLQDTQVKAINILYDSLYQKDNNNNNNNNIIKNGIPMSLLEKEKIKIEKEINKKNN